MRIRKTISLLLLVVYAFLFASANFFYHSHSLEDGTVVHSHLFAGCKTHNHTAAQLQIIDQLNTATYDKAEPVQVHQVIDPYSIELVIVRSDTVVSLEAICSFSLRAPPIC